MKNLLFALLFIFLCAQTFSQKLNVVGKDGQTQQFNLSEINNITFNKSVVSLMNTGSQPLIMNNLFVHTKTESIGMFISAIDSIYYNEDGTIANFKTAGGLKQFIIVDIDSITFGTISDSTVYISYKDTSVSIINPLESLGVSIDVDGADVIVNANSGLTDINYVLTGAATDGMFKIYSDKKLNLHLNNVSITNNDGPAINIQSGKKISVYLENGTNNFLTDGLTYADPPSGEDQKSAFFSEGQLIFSGSGRLEITGLASNKHALCSDDYIEINEGDIIIKSTAKDGIHVNDGFFMNGGTLDITSSEDGIDAGSAVVEISDGTITIKNTGDDQNAIKADSTIIISGGIFNITVAGKQSKGVKSKQTISLSNCSLSINTTGGVYLKPSGSGFKPSYCTAIKSDLDVVIDSSNITIITSGAAGRGISCDGNLIFNSGTLQITSSGHGATYTNASGQTDAYAGHCISTDGSIIINNGALTLNHSGKGGKGIKGDANLTIGTVSYQPTINITTTGQPIYIGPDNYSESKAISIDSTIRIFDGNITISSADDGIKSKDSLIIYDGTININQSTEGLETPNLIINGGEISVKASDDGINTTYGQGGELNDGSKMIINDGYIFVTTTQGDALDANGDIFINGGVIVAQAPSATGFTFEVGLDFNGQCKITDGFVVISGTNSMLTQAPSNTSTQHSVLLKSSQSIQAGTIFHIEDANGVELLTFAPPKVYYSIIFSDSTLISGGQYKVYTGGSYSGGTIKNGLYSGGTYTPGTLRKTFTLTSMVQTISF